MNIFYVNSDPNICAQELPDIYTGSKSKGGKMIIESCQMLANVYTNEQLRLAPLTQNGTIRKHSYIHHPCSKWVLASSNHWFWLLNHATEMVKEKLFRGGKLHFSSCFLDWCRYNPPTIEAAAWQDPPQCMPSDFFSENCIKSYRDYLLLGKTHLTFTWTNRTPPFWWKQACSSKVRAGNS